MTTPTHEQLRELPLAMLKAHRDTAEDGLVTVNLDYYDALIAAAEKCERYERAITEIAGIPKAPACGWLRVFESISLAEAALGKEPQ